MSTLYVVATPIGNLEDMSPRALRVLREADLILAEDTRVTRKLLTAFSIRTQLLSHHMHNEAGTAEQVITRMKAEDLAVALVSDAGTPAISDPGARLVALAHQAGIRVLAVPGPSALAAGLSVSGFEQGEAAFYGFLPRKPGELREKLRALRQGPPLAVLYESPHRVLALLKAIASEFPGCRLSISRELTKLHEQTLRATVEEALAHFTREEGARRGEFALVLEIPQMPAEAPADAAPLSLEARLFDCLARGMSLRDAKAELVKLGERKNAVYAAGLQVLALARKLNESE